MSAGTTTIKVTEKENFLSIFPTQSNTADGTKDMRYKILRAPRWQSIEGLEMTCTFSFGK